VNAAGEGERLPQSIGGLVDFAFAGWAERAPLYLALGLGVFAACSAIEAWWPAKTEHAAAVKLLVLVYVELLGLAFIVGAAAIGVATRAAGERVSWRMLLSGALYRWTAVFGAMIIVQLVVQTTLPFSALGPLPDPPALAIITAPVIWLLWGVVNLAGPIAALSGDRALIAMITSFPRAIMLSLRRENAARICVLGFATIVPTVAASVLFDVLVKRGLPHAEFWSNVPIDALTAGPLVAIQTTFALDFARRAGEAAPP
jgi:hypothetical protein